MRTTVYRSHVVICDDEKTEIRAAIKYFIKKSMKATENHANFRTHRVTLFHHIQLLASGQTSLKCGRENLEDNSRSGRPRNC